MVTTWVNIPLSTAPFPTTRCEPAVFPMVSGDFRELRIVPGGTPILEGWKLASALAVETNIEENYFIARLRSLDEYGVGTTSEAALDDLLTSLVDYMKSLQQRADRLSEPLKRDLGILRNILGEQ